MQKERGVSRRTMLELAGAMGSIALFDPRTVWAQAAKRIEQMAPELTGIIDTTQPIVELAKGYGGDVGPAEGPVWIAEGKYLLFEDIETSRRLKFPPGQGVSVISTNTHEANGLTRDLQGRLVQCEHATRSVTRTELDGSTTV